VRGKQRIVRDYLVDILDAARAVGEEVVMSLERIIHEMPYDGEQ